MNRRRPADRSADRRPAEAFRVAVRAARAAIVLLACATAAFAQSVEGEEGRAGADNGDGVAGGAALERAVAKAPPRARRVVKLAPLDVPKLRAEDDARREALGDDWKRSNRVGVVRGVRPVVVPASPTRWGDRAETLADGSRVFRIEVSAPGATGLRLRFRKTELPPGSELTVSNAARPAEAYGPLRVPASQSTWLAPTVFGDRAVLALRVPAEQLTPKSRVRLVVDGVVQRYRPPEETRDEDVSVSGPAGKAATGSMSCMNRVACDDDFAATVARGVGRFEFTNGGDAFLCTGTLLTDLDPTTQIPWLLTANHCISTEKAAQSVEVFWDYRTATCTSAVPLIHLVPRSLGTTLAATAAGPDCSLLRVTGALPDGRYFCGWTATRPLPGDAVTGVHHPQGTHMRISYGNLDTTSAHLHTVVWQDGVTAEGSSGSALFNAQKQVVGQLCCGASYCNRPRAPDDYGRFDRAYVSILGPHLGAEDAASGPDAWDPADDTALGATPLGAPTLKGVGHGPHTLHGTDDADWFRVELTRGVAYVFEATVSDAAGGSVRADLFSDVAGVNPVASTAGGSTGFSLVATAAKNGKHWLRVTRATPGIDAAFEIAALKKDLVPPAKVGGLRASASQGTVTISWQDLARDERGYRVAMRGPDGWVRIADLPRNARRFRHHPGPGRHMYRVGPYDAANTAWTVVRVRVTGKPGLDEWDPSDDTGVGATPLEALPAAETPVHELDRNDIGDWFRIDLAGGETWTFEADSDGDTVGGVYADAGGSQPLADGDDQVDPDSQAVLDEDFRITFTAPATGTYWVQVKAYPNRPRATYTLLLTRQL